MLLFNIQLFSADFGMRPMTVKQAQKWLDKIKGTNANSFKELSKILKRYERSSDDYECFVKLNTLLLDHPELTVELNGFLEEGNKFVVNQSQVEKINELVKYIRRVDMTSFQEIASYITKLHTDKRNQPQADLNEDQQNKLVRNHVLFQVKGKPELQSYAQKALFITAEEMIKQLNLNHLKVSRPQESASRQQQQQPQQITYQPPVQRQQPIIQLVQPKTKMYPPFINQNEEKIFFRQFEANLDPYIYEQIIKVIHIYHLGIISRVEALDLVKPYCEGDYSAIKDLIQSRQADRRRNSTFRPLNDMDFTNVERATHSYVKMPEVYPHYCSQNSSFLKQILNKKWVSVPRGSQETFNVRIKNSYEQNLIKSEDDRYQFDIYFKRLQKALQMTNKVVTKLKQKQDADISADMQAIISLGIIQTLYKNCPKQQKEQMQFYLRNMKYDTLLTFQARLHAQHMQLKQMRSIHGLRNWTEIANKNFHKALDFKGHEFKRTEKLKMKAGVFLDELKVRINYLKSKGQSKSYDTPFEDKREFFSILNSFETSSRKQRCISRKLPIPRQYNIKDNQLPTLLPAMILSFEDQQVMSAVYSFVAFYLDNAVLNESEKIRCKNTFRQIMSQFFGLKSFQLRSLSSHFDEQKFFSQILNGEPATADAINVDDWIQTEAQSEFQSPAAADETDKIPSFKSIQDTPSEYSFEPPKTEYNLVFYATENFYVLLRFLYALYERIIRMKEVAQNQRKEKLFEMLYFACIKAKEGARFEDSLNTLFGEYAYLFTTLYKLLESLQKCLNTVSLCQLYLYSLRHMQFDSEQIYLLLLNRFMLNNGMTTSRLMRFTYQPFSHLLYINSFDSYYRIDDQTKQLQRRRADITSKIQIYTLMKSDEGEEKTEPKNLQRNQMQYCFEGNSIKMINLCSKEDFLINDRKPSNKDDLLKELKWNKKLRQRVI